MDSPRNDTAVPPSPERLEQNPAVAERLHALREKLRELLKDKEPSALALIDEFEDAVCAQKEEKFKLIVEKIVADVLRKYPAWKFLDPVLKARNEQRKNGNAEQLLKSLIEAFGIFGNLNPWGTDLELNEAAEVHTHRKEVALVYSDIRNFAGLVHVLQSHAFRVLQQVYISFVMRLAAHHSMHVINPAGDSFVFYCTDGKNERGEVEQSKSLKAMKFAMELKWLTDLIALQLEEKKFSKRGAAHCTGISLATGSLIFGDGAREEAITNDAAGEVRSVLTQSMDERGYPALPPEKQRRLTVALGDSIDMAARLGALHKSHVGQRNMFVEQRFWLSLPEQWRNKFEVISEMHLSHLGTETYLILAMPEKSAAQKDDVPSDPNAIPGVTTQQ